MVNKFVLSLKDVDKHSIQLVGGKGANLGELISNKFPVPDGFCVSVEAYKELIIFNSLENKIYQIVNDINWKNPADIEHKSAMIRNLIMEQAITHEIEQEILKSYQELEKNRNGKVYVAVRSSATAEDLPDASFAGQQDTYLYISGENELLHYVKSCWASLWSARAMAYRKQKGYDHSKVFIAVVIQEMINAKASGILFTNNPLSQNENEMLVTSSFGLGEPVVSGQVTPDSFTINKEKLNVISKELGTKEKELVIDTNEKTVLLDVPNNRREEFSLSNEQLRKLGALSIKVEKHYGTPQDIEWAYADDKLYLLQSRPITTLNKKEQFTFGKLNNTQIKILDDLLEHYPEAPTPLDYSVVTMSYQSLLDRGNELGISLSKATEIITLDKEGMISLRAPKIKLKWKLVFLLQKLLKAANGQDNQLKEVKQEFETYVEKLKGLNPKSLSDQDIIKEFNNVFNLAEKISRLRFLLIADTTIIPFLTLSIIIKIFTAKKDRPALSDIITTNLDFKTSVIDKSLNQLAIQITKYPEVKSLILEGSYVNIDNFQSKLVSVPNGKQILDEIQLFLNQYGYRTEKMYQPFTSKSWLDDQMYFLDILKAVLNDPQLLERKSKEQVRNEKHRLWLLQFKHKLKGPFQNLFEWSYERLRKLYIYREETVFFIEVLFHFGRKIIKELGERLKKEGILEDSKDIIYIQKDELISIFSKEIDKKEFIKLLKKRKENMKKNQLTWKQSIIQLSRKADKDSNVITGISGSNGLAEGPVRIITNVDDFKKLKQGDILVCQYTDPAWTPLFGVAGAVVADTGGPLSHAAIVAREYGIPAVLGTKIGTSSLKDEELIIVDGTEGKIIRKQSNTI